jgi:hypothetical protein
MTTGPETATPNQDAQLKGLADMLLASMGGANAINDSGNRAQSGTSVTSEATRLTYNAAKALLEATMQSIDFKGKLTADDINDFMAKFKAEQNKQIGKVVVSSSSKTTAGATPDAASKVAESTFKQEYPSFFDPAGFAKDYVWAKVNFKNEANLGAKALDALAKVRGLVDKFQLMGVSNNDALIAAKQIAMGKKTIEAYTVELQQVAKKEYPQFADRFAMDPELTTYDIASPIIKMLAKTWEVDEDTVKMDNPLVMSYMNYAGPDGKGQPPSRYDLLLKAKNDPKYQLTEEANNNARDTATSFARAFGFGV